MNEDKAEVVVVYKDSNSSQEPVNPGQIGSNRYSSIESEQVPPLKHQQPSIRISDKGKSHQIKSQRDEPNRNDRVAIALPSDNSGQTQIVVVYQPDEQQGTKKDLRQNQSKGREEKAGQGKSQKDSERNRRQQIVTPQRQKKVRAETLFVFNEDNLQSEKPVDRNQQGSSANKQDSNGKQEDNEKVSEDSISPIQKVSFRKLKNTKRGIGIFLLFLLAVLFFIFGFLSQYKIVNSTSYPVNLTTQPIFGATLAMTSIFAVIGFGMLLMYFKKMTESAILVTLFIMSYTVLFQLVFMKFWHNVFRGDFSSYSSSTYAHDFFINQGFGGGIIYFDLYTLKIAIVAGISHLVVILAVYGRMNIAQLVIFTFFYNIGWSLNFNVMIKLHNLSSDARFFDDNQISMVYLFASCFGLITFLFAKKIAKDPSYEHSNYSGIFACIGSFFIFCTFCGTSILYSIKSGSQSSQRNILWVFSIQNNFFSLSSNVLTTFIFSVLFAGKFKLRWTVFGVLMGGIIFGCVSEISNTIAAAIACGAGSALLTVVYFSKIHSRLNRNTVTDSYGIFLVLVISLIASISIASTILRVYFTIGTILPSLSTSTNISEPVPNKQIALYSLIYPGVSIAVGCGCGLIVNLILRIFSSHDSSSFMTDKLFLSEHHGLRVQAPPKKKKQKRIIQQQLEQKDRELNSEEKQEKELKKQKKVQFAPQPTSMGNLKEANNYQGIRDTQDKNNDKRNKKDGQDQNRPASGILQQNSDDLTKKDEDQQEEEKEEIINF